MTDRRYTEEESSIIFRLAAQGPSTQPDAGSPAHGLTLADLQAVGREVGLTPDAIARAAQTLEIRQGAVSRRFLGLPVGVERQVTLGHRLTDDEWERVVVRLREVFQARGVNRTDGTLRQWTNGNLYALVEPTPTGDRFRLGSVHGGAVTSIRFGIMSLAVMSVIAIGNLLGAHLADAGAVAGLLSGGLFLVANGALRLPRWSRVRAAQIEGLAAELALPPGLTERP